MDRGPITIVAAAASAERDLARSLRQVAGVIGRARARGADLLVLPESQLGGYLREPRGDGEAADLVGPAVGLDGPELTALCRAAGDLVVCLGITEQGAGGDRHSTAVCLSGDGLLGVQRKVHLPPAERFAFTPGACFAAFDTPVGRLGMLVCYDKLFPEAARALALDGADVICCLAAWAADRHAPARRLRDDRQLRHFDAVDVARAVESQVVWVSANQAGRWAGRRMLGAAKVVDPDGAVLARTRPGRDGLAVARIDPAAAVADARGRFDHLGDRRPAAYGMAPGTGRHAVGAR
ncbi:carbon-nitrogen hydrolase family protein [Conexibacter sp. SYSU D00693]|uniref:carbon-nitrogen hydrolase family protein n=1 Tax=Conexibacter sp. SYSU D00693 TaxID=2812560 RepID=UPI00196BA15A|nr:carbon-nitrogen hydrolase family protein [Conexibacter sp. SYSU D00693]